MSRIFIQAYCQFPHGSALANYVQNWGKAVSYAGYDVILVTDINKDFDLDKYKLFYKSMDIVSISPSENMAKRQLQRKNGFCEERLDVLKRYRINKSDKVIVLGIRNEVFLEKLFEFREKIQFKIICGVFELFGREDFNKEEDYRKAMHIKGEVYLQANAILSISEYIDKYYKEKGKRTFCFPPMIDIDESIARKKKMNKYCFIILSPKDSLKSMLMAFAALTREEINKIELHLCGIESYVLKEVIGETEWIQLKKCIKIHNWMDYEELTTLYKKMHFLVIARNICQRTLANFPSKVPEVMMYRIVPIVSDVGDYTKYYLKDGYDSIFIKDDSVKEIQNAIRKAMSMDLKEYRSYSENAQKTAKERFDYHIWAPQIREMLEGV